MSINDVTRFYLKGAVLGFLLLAGVMLLIRAQPYDDHELRALLMPENCEMPCFIGIRPGVTTVDEAVQILRMSAWIKDLTLPIQVALPMADEQVTWDWNERFPYWNSYAQNQVPYTSNFLEAKGGVVKTIALKTSINLADFEALWKEPDNYTVQALDYGHLYYAVVYTQKQAHFIGLLSTCPYFPSIWSQSVNWVLGDRQSLQLFSESPNDGLFFNQVIQWGHRSCSR